MKLPLAAEAFDRRFGTTRAVLVNLYTEQSREGPTESRRVPRPGLALFSTFTPGPIRCFIRNHNGNQFCVSGTRVYKNTTQVGIIPGQGRLRWATYDEQLVIVETGEGVAYLVDTSITPITMPDGDLVSDVVVAAGRFLYTIKDTGKFRYSDIADATTIGDLNFASAESDPDNIVSAETLGDDVIFFGQNTTEWHSPTSDVDAPFIRNGGRRYDKGSAAQNTAVKIDNTIFWVGTAQQGSDLQVYRASAVPVAISNEGIETALAACEDITQATAVAIVSTGHSFYVLNIPGVGTYAFDVKTGLWGVWKSFGQTTFRVQCGDDGVYGDNQNGQLWTIDPDRRTDGDDTIVYEVSASLAVEEGVYRANALRLHLRTGVGAPGGSPVMEMRYATHGGEVWSSWREMGIGAPGEHPVVIARQLGLARPPGLTFEFRCSGGVDFIPHGVTMDLTRGDARL